jgi:hypothetical protein
VLRITISDGPDEKRWIVQGHLTAPWVAELETSWKKSPSRHHARRWVVDLREVTLIDKRGEKILKTMRRAGAEFIASGVYTKQVVEDINSQCRRGSEPETMDLSKSNHAR